LGGGGAESEQKEPKNVDLKSGSGSKETLKSNGEQYNTRGVFIKEFLAGLRRDPGQPST